MFAPEFAETPIESFLQDLKIYNVVAIRKYFADPRKADYPLYVLTFIGEAPEILTLGYVKFKLDKYYSSPMQCKKCYLFGHTAAKCRNSTICVNCTYKEHTEDQCTSPTFICTNCRLNHASNSKQCSSFIKEKEICTLQADLNISFADARELVKERSNASANVNNLPNTNPQSISRNNPHPNISSTYIFPPIQNRNSSSQQYNNNPSMPSCSNIQQQNLLDLNDYNEPSQSIPQYSQESAWFPSQQQQTSSNVNQTIYPSQLSLPSLSQQKPVHSTNSPLLSPHRVQTYPSPTTNSQLHDDNNNITTATPCSSVLPQSFLPIIHKLLPLLIKLLFAESMSDKLESIINIGQIFQADSLVSSTLSALNITSALSQ